MPPQAACASMNASPFQEGSYPGTGSAATVIPTYSSGIAGGAQPTLASPTHFSGRQLELNTFTPQAACAAATNTSPFLLQDGKKEIRLGFQKLERHHASIDFPSRDIPSRRGVTDLKANRMLEMKEMTKKKKTKECEQQAFTNADRTSEAEQEGAFFRKKQAIGVVGSRGITATDIDREFRHLSQSLERTIRRSRQSQPGAYAEVRFRSSPTPQIGSVAVFAGQQQQQVEEDDIVQRLVEASPVADELPQLQWAKPVLTVGSRLSPEQQRCSQTIYMQVCWLAVAIYGAIVVDIAVSESVWRDHDEKDSLSVSPNSSLHPPIPTSDATSMPSRSHYLNDLLQSLPNNATLQNPLSPQSLAVDWLLKHDDLAILEEWRKEQLFAMGTFFYSMGGPSWPRDIGSDWMDASRHECYWFSLRSTLFVEKTETYVHTNDSACNEQGQVESLFLGRLEAVDDSSETICFIPPEMEMLPELKTLSLTLSMFNGPLVKVLPPQLFQMKNLESIMLAANGLSGMIPSEFGLLKEL